jgi:hypothetical protein
VSLRDRLHRAQTRDIGRNDVHRLQREGVRPNSPKPHPRTLPILGFGIWWIGSVTTGASATRRSCGISRGRPKTGRRRTPRR